VPVGSEVEFYLTARDVIHGWQVEDTNLNVQVIPGEVSRLRTRFDRVGRYRVTCNEYCGIGHQNMIGWIDVVPASQWALAAAVGDASGGGGRTGRRARGAASTPPTAPPATVRPAPASPARSRRWRARRRDRRPRRRARLPDRRAAVRPAGAHRRSAASPTTASCRPGAS
jgi:hypothetical protein